jgi:hypothetical protein
VTDPFPRMRNGSMPRPFSSAQLDNMAAGVCVQAFG